MKKSLTCFFIVLLEIFALSGCEFIGSKSASMAIIYIITTILSLLLLICYCYLASKKDVWFLLLFGSVLVVNIGYLSLSISKSLEEALLANRISYLGSVFLPMSMLMIILNVTRANYKKWFPGLLLIISIAVFLVAASPGYLDIYYKEVFLETINGVTILKKVYGPWHHLYLFYLLTYFAAMIGSIVQSIIKKTATSLCHSVILAIAVFVNIGVWFIEQLIHMDFEILSISYIITEFFILGLHVLMTENEELKEMLSHSEETENNQKYAVKSDIESSLSDSEIQAHKICSCTINEIQDERLNQFLSDLTSLTKTERLIFDHYVSGKTTKEIMNKMNITENTLKFHNKNIYSKLGVSSRKQLVEIYKMNK